MAKTIWKKETPTKEGWYWMQYKGGRRLIECPAEVTIFKDGTVMVKSAYNDSFYEGPNHGGPGLKHVGKRDKSIRFANKIRRPK